MELVVLVVMLALIQYVVFGIQVGSARRKYGIRAPAMSGHVMFERALRVQMNTLEMLVVFVPAAFSYAYLADRLGWYGSETAAFLGVVYLIGRLLYARAYKAEPSTRALGFGLTGGALVAVLFTVI